jgi:hypothetical protein
MQLHWNPNDDTPAGISIRQIDRKKLATFLRNQKPIHGVPRIAYDEYCDGLRDFMPFQHFEMMMDEFGDEFIDLFFER